MDDEAFARQLQQQLLDEEAALMQAQQASHQQQHQQQSHVQPQSHLVDDGPGIDPLGERSGHTAGDDRSTERKRRSAAPIVR